MFDNEQHEALKYKVCGLDRVFDEKGSVFLALRKLQWGIDQNEQEDPEKVKLDIRKYYSKPDGKERLSKGVSFLTEEGPSELVHVLLEEGYGDTQKCLEVLKERENFKEAVTFVFNMEEKGDNSEFFDPRQLLDM